jgi:hypothetical protein
MKTPREILFKRYQTAQPQLDRLREEVVSEIRNPKAEARKIGLGDVDSSFGTRTSFGPRTSGFGPGLLRAVRVVWLELIWPSRRIWAGLAVVWLALLAFNLGQGALVSGGARSAPAPAMVQSFVEQERLLAELLQPAKPAPVVEQPRPATRPRSERRLDWRAS